MSVAHPSRVGLLRSWLLARRPYWGIVIGVTITLLVLLFVQGISFFERAELSAYDAHFLRRGAVATPRDIVLVGLDYTSIQDLSPGGRYPIPRARFGQAIDFLHRAGARAIGIDFLYISPSQYGSRDDQTFAAAVKRAGNVVLAEQLLGPEASRFPGVTPSVMTPIGPLARAAAALGMVNSPIDADGTLRSADLMQEGPSSGGTSRLYPSLAVAVAGVATHQSAADVVRGLPQQRMHINFVGPQSVGDASQQSFLMYQFDAVARGQDSYAPFRNKIVLIVPAADILKDTFNTPYGLMYGGVTEANALNTILRRDPIISAGAAGNNLILLLLGLVVTVGASRLGLWRSVAATALIAVAFAAVSVGLFEALHVWVNLVTPEVAIGLIFVAVMAVRAPAEVGAMRLAAGLQHSRERLVTLREEERRRLRRDLHDGLGPILATVMLDINAARRLLGPDSPAEPVLLEARSGVQSAIADIRRLVYDLRPPTLDELGLAGAIRQTATGYERNGLLISVQVPEDVPPLPAAVEVAAYRIVQEALTNVVRHAQARTCAVRLSLADTLEVEVTDDGVGVPVERHIGVGLNSMRERAAELGGSCVVTPAPGGGTRVHAQLPILAV